MALTKQHIIITWASSLTRNLAGFGVKIVQLHFTYPVKPLQCSTPKNLEFDKVIIIVFNDKVTNAKIITLKLLPATCTRNVYFVN